MSLAWGAACLMASCNLSVDTLPHVPKKPITPLSDAFSAARYANFYPSTLGSRAVVIHYLTIYFSFSLILRIWWLIYDQKKGFVANFFADKYKIQAQLNL